MTLLQKAMAILALIAIVAVITVFGVRQYGNARVAAQELVTVKEAVSEAVQERKQAVKADAQASIKKATVAQEMRTAGNAARKELNAAQVQNGPDRPAPEPRDYRVFNDLIQRGNRAIESSR